MSPIRIHFGLAILLLVIGNGLTAWGQEQRELPGMQLFDPADPRPYGDNFARPREGFFIAFDGIFWHMSAPTKTTIGVPGLTRTVLLGNGVPGLDEILEANSVDTGQLRAKWKQGDRIEFGFQGEHHGFLVSTIELNRQTEFIAAGNAAVEFNDPPQGPLGARLLAIPFIDPVTGATVFENVPVRFTQLSATNILKITNCWEALYVYRMHQLHCGANVEWMLGGRYMWMEDEFHVDAFGGNLADSNWDNDVKQQIGGPEIGVRLSMPWGRFGFSTEGRFMAGVNNESVHFNGQLGTNLNTDVPNAPPLPRLMNASGFTSTARFTEFTPLVEFRAEAHCAVTRLIQLKAGYTAMWMNGIGRAADMIDYTVPNMGITTANHGQKDDLIIQGFNVGIELNR